MRYITYIIISSIVFIMSIALPFSMMTTYGDQLPDEMKVHFIDVGQGDSILIETPEGKNILIDGGRPEYGEKVVSYLGEQKIKTLDMIMATHPDSDHIGGLAAVMKKTNASKMIDSVKLHKTRT